MRSDAGLKGDLAKFVQLAAIGALKRHGAQSMPPPPGMQSLIAGNPLQGTRKILLFFGSRANCPGLKPATLMRW